MVMVSPQLSVMTLKVNGRIDVSIMVEWEDPFVSPFKSTRQPSITQLRFFCLLTCLKDPHISTSEGGRIGTHRRSRIGGRKDDICKHCYLVPEAHPEASANVVVLEELGCSPKQQAKQRLRKAKAASALTDLAPILHPSQFQQGLVAAADMYL